MGNKKFGAKILVGLMVRLVEYVVKTAGAQKRKKKKKKGY